MSETPLSPARKRHTWSGDRCIRNRRGRSFVGEDHPCYWCGKPLTDMLNLDPCNDCGGIFCPSCDNCWCNVSDEEFEALRQLRRKYCCNLFHFRTGVRVADSIDLLRLVPHFVTALDYCREKENYQ